MAKGIVLDEQSVPGSVGQTNPLPVRVKYGTTGDDVGDGHTVVNDGKGAVTTAGTRVRLPNVVCKRAKIICSEWNGDEANCPNGGIIVVGGSSVVAALATRQGVPLYPTQGEWFNISNLNLLYVDALDDGAKYHYMYEN